MDGDGSWRCNWYFVLPNLYGVDTCHGYCRHQFAGVAIELTHGVAISWDGRRVRHCTSVFKHGHPNNHVYATFCAPKVRVLNFAQNGRASGQDRSLAVTDNTSAGTETEGEESCRSNNPLENICIPRKKKASLLSYSLPYQQLVTG
jgi:hypothetical protein